MRLVLLLGFFIGIASCKEGKKPSAGITVFEFLDASASGISFNNQLEYTEDFNIYLYKSFYNGAGVGMADFNNDGLQDLFFCGNQVDNRLYLNLGDFKFRDVTETSSVASQGAWSTGVSIVDINADGWMDIYVCKSGKPDSKNRKNELFVHTGKLDASGNPIFEEKANEWGIDDLGFSVNATFFDYDQDGDLDMYLLNNSINPSEVVLDAKKGLREIYDADGGNKLYKNIGNRFVDATKEAGIYGSAIGFGLGASVGDVNRDGWPDLYVANDFFEKDYLYYNNKDGTFREALERSLNEISQGAMGVDIADLTNDGWPEIFVTEMLPNGHERQKTKVLFDGWDSYALRLQNGYHRQFPRNTLQLNQGLKPWDSISTFSEVSRFAGTAATEWSWGVHMLDLDNDAQKEIYVTNGIVKDLLDQDYIDFYNNADQLRKMYQEKGAVIKELVDKMPSSKVSNFLYKNDGNLCFHDLAVDWGLGTPSFSTGAAFGDLDNDGDLDLVVNNLNAPPFLYRNTTKKNFLNLKLMGDRQNKDAIGSQATIYVNGQIQYQELFPVRGTMSTMDNRLNFGVGNSDQVDSLEIRWPDGGYTVLHDVAANQFLKVGRTKVKITERPSRNVKDDVNVFMLKEVTDANFGFQFAHQENAYLDLNRDKLRYNSISKEGPKMALADVDGDNVMDVFIGNASGSLGMLYKASKIQGFSSHGDQIFEKDKQAEDAGAVFVDADNDGDQDLLVASGGYEYPSSSFALANRLYLNDGKGNFKKSNQVIPSGKLYDTSVILPADIDNDGDMDLFAGSRTQPLAYGVPAPSFLLQNDGAGNFSDITKSHAQFFGEMGMVTDAAWFDYDNDNDQDLVVVGEWMPIRLFENDEGFFTEKTNEKGLSATNGLWNTLEVADLDNDGYPDLIVGNLGKNTFFKASDETPLTLYVNDFDANGQIDHVLGIYENGKLYPMATKKEMTAQMPYLLKKYLKHSDYADQTIQDIFTPEQLENAIKLIVNQTASMVFWNNQGVFEGVTLPLEAQLSSIYAILPVDLNQDGYQELVLGGNLFTAKPQTGTYDGSCGLVLKVMADRTIKSLSPAQSGFYVKGQIRDIKSVSIGNKELILVARNNDEIKVFEKNR
ncbi:VCBS repeat-containing protein [Maribacter sp. 2307ULW6-5]|uniref:VCBS repeat-containing protein n=1 Tax=Maribacter sp. 2307ULW6-5 TaxID=3386275 RepID=UPI0039BD0026